MTDKDKIISIDLFDKQNNFISTFGKKAITIKEDSYPYIVIIKAKNLPELEIGIQLNIIFTTVHRQRLKYDARVSVSTPYQLNIELMSVSPKIMKERRNYLKIKIDEEVRLMCSCINGEIETYDRSKRIFVRDINVGGVYVITELKLNVSDVIKLRIDLGFEKLEVTAEVLRVEEMDNKCGAGCKFILNTTKDEEALAKYIYQKERELRNKHKLN